jgi:hypothetical protein
MRIYFYGLFSLLGLAIFLTYSYSYGQQPSIDKNATNELDNVLLNPPLKINLGIVESTTSMTEDELSKNIERVGESKKAIPLAIRNSSIEGPAVNTESSISSQPNLTSDSESSNLQERIDTPISNINGTGLNIYTDTEVGPIKRASLVNEPSVASDGKNTIFYTGNWYAMRSIDGGKNWQNVNWKKDFDYCCDQRVVYDPNHGGGIFIWYRQGADGKDNAETVSIAVSKDTNLWAIYYINGSSINQEGLGDKEFDYPFLVLGDKYVYITTNVFQPGRDLTGSLILRISLEDLSKFSLSPRASYYYEPGIFTFTPVNGAHEKMYWASHINNYEMKIYEWNESEKTDNIKYNIVEIPNWSPIRKGDLKCSDRPSIGAELTSNWCGRIDSRIDSGWYSNNTIGFFWTAGEKTKPDISDLSKETKKFPFPYENAATFDVSNGVENIKYEGTPYLWSYDFAWTYAAASPNKDGKVGLVAFYGNYVDVPPNLAFGITDDLTKPAGWKMISLKNSTHFPAVASDKTYDWGDYLTVAPSNKFSNAWDVAGFILKDGNTNKNVKPYYFVMTYKDPQNFRISLEKYLQ